MKIHFFLDRRSVFCTLLLAFMMTGAYGAYRAGQIGMGILCTVLSLLPLTFILLWPCFYVMTPKGLWIFYFFFLSHEYYLWEKVEEVTVVYDTGRKSWLYVFDTFAIVGESEDKDRFYKKGEIVRTLRARLLIEKYTGKKITGFYIDDFKAWLKERRRKAERMKAHRERQQRVQAAREERARQKQMKTKNVSKSKKGNRHE